MVVGVALLLLFFRFFIVEAVRLVVIDSILSIIYPTSDALIPSCLRIMAMLMEIEVLAC